jgi:hypothetical protein
MIMNVVPPTHEGCPKDPVVVSAFFLYAKRALFGSILYGVVLRSYFKPVITEEQLESRQESTVFAVENVTPVTVDLVGGQLVYYNTLDVLDYDAGANNAACPRVSECFSLIKGEDSTTNCLIPLNSAEFVCPPIFVSVFIEHFNPYDVIRVRHYSWVGFAKVDVGGTGLAVEVKREHAVRNDALTVQVRYDESTGLPVNATPHAQDAIVAQL